MGRPTKSKRDKRKNISLSFKSGIIRRIDELKSDRSRSEFVESYLESLMFSDKAYAAYEIHQARSKIAFWEYQYAVAEARSRNKQLKLVET